ncbi:MAG: hypothetical protein JSS87_06620 [Acidobacteria bacterium]|nr:hypothetical protein [Acidobacteriota bacterium]
MMFGLRTLAGAAEASRVVAPAAAIAPEAIAALRRKSRREFLLDSLILKTPFSTICKRLHRRDWRLLMSNSESFEIPEVEFLWIFCGKYEENAIFKAQKCQNLPK